MTGDVRETIREARNLARRAEIEALGGYEAVEYTRRCAYCGNDYLSRLRVTDGRLSFCPRPATCRQNFYHEQQRIRARQTFRRAFGVSGG